MPRIRPASLSSIARAAALPAALGLVLSAGSAFPAGTSAREVALDLLRTYSPQGWNIVHRFEKAPRSFTICGSTIRLGMTAKLETYLRGGAAPLAVAASLNTAVHELCHGHSTLIAYQMLTTNERPHKDYEALFVSSRETVLLGRTKIFPTTQWGQTVPAALRTFRFKDYVYPSEAVMGSVQHGAYGLLEEMCAYYNGTRVSVDLFAFYKTLAPSLEAWKQYISEFHGTAGAHWEFRFFVLGYLLYAKKQAPDVYRGIVENADFRFAWAKIRRYHDRLVERFNETKKELAGILAKAGGGLKEQADGLTLSLGDESMTIGTLDEVTRVLAPELAKPEYVALETLLGAR